MSTFLTFFGLVLLFAWVARALLGARSLTWVRTLIAAILGMVAGFLVAALILYDDGVIDATEVATLSLPLSLIGTMVALVALEMLFMRKPQKHGYRRPVKALRRWFGMWARGWQVTRILGRHGLARLLGLRRGRREEGGATVLARQVRLALEEAGGMFVKLGQLLASRPDLLPPEAIEELGRLQSDAAPLTQEEVRSVIEKATGVPLEQTFASFDWDPLGSASIGQAHSAVLVNGATVVVKVRRPGLDELVERDTGIMRWLAGVAERRTDWAKTYGLTGMADEFAADLQSELDFTIEARHTAEMAESVRRYPVIHVPRVVPELVTDRMLVMERLEGMPLAKIPADSRGQLDLKALADALCASQVTAMLRGQRFHGDPHQGNVLVLDDGRLGLVDFGVTDRLDTFERSAVFEILVAMKLEDPVVLFDGLMTIGAVGPSHDPDRVQRALAQFLASHSLAGQPSPEVLTDLLRLTNRMGMRMPSSTTTMFRALATLAGTLESLSPGYPLLEAVGEIGGAELRERATPSSVSEFLQQEWAQMGPIFKRAPTTSIVSPLSSSTGA